MIKKPAIIQFLLLGCLLVSSFSSLNAQIESRGEIYRNQSGLVDEILTILNDSVTRTDVIHGLEVANTFSEELIQGGQILFNDSISELSNKVLLEIIDKNTLEISGVNVYTLRWTSIEAFSLSNRDIYLSVGLIERLTNVDQLAFVIAHELSHLTHAHSAAAVGEPGYARSQETQSDKDAMEWLAGAGFNPARALSLLDLFKFKHAYFDRAPRVYRELEDSFFSIPKRILLPEVKSIDPLTEYRSSFHTHPLLSERKNQLSQDSISDERSPFEDHMTAVSRISRIAMCELYLLELDYPSALYQALLCQKLYPGESLPGKVRAYVFYGAYQLAQDSKRSQCLKADMTRYDEEERLYFILDQASMNDLFVMAMREVWLGYKLEKDPFFLKIGSHLIDEMPSVDINSDLFLRERSAPTPKSDTSDLSPIESIKRRRASMEMSAYSEAFIPLFRIQDFKRLWESGDRPNTSNSTDVTTYSIYEGSIIYPDSVAYLVENVLSRNKQRKKFSGFVVDAASRHNMSVFAILQSDTIRAGQYNKYQQQRDYIREIRTYDRIVGEGEMRQIPYSYLMHPDGIESDRIAIPSLFMRPSRRNFNPFFTIWSVCMVYPIPWYVIWQSSYTYNLTYRMEWYDSRDHRLIDVEWVETRSRFRNDIVKSRLDYSITNMTP